MKWVFTPQLSLLAEFQAFMVHLFIDKKCAEFSKGYFAKDVQSVKKRAPIIFFPLNIQNSNIDSIIEVAFISRDHTKGKYDCIFLSSMY